MMRDSDGERSGNCFDTFTMQGKMSPRKARADAKDTPTPIRLLTLLSVALYVRADIIHQLTKHVLNKNLFS